MKHVLREQNGQSFLFRNEKPLQCPYSPVQKVPVKGSGLDLRGGVEIREIRPMCGSWCPLFNVHEKTHKVSLHCSKDGISYTIED